MANSSSFIPFLPTFLTLHNVDLWPHHSCVSCGLCSQPLHLQSWGRQPVSSITGKFIEEASAPDWGSAASTRQKLQEQETRTAAAPPPTTIHLPLRRLWRWLCGGISYTRPLLWCWQQQSNWHPWSQSSKSEYYLKCGGVEETCWSYCMLILWNAILKINLIVIIFQEKELRSVHIPISAYPKSLIQWPVDGSTKNKRISEVKKQVMKLSNITIIIRI